MVVRVWTAERINEIKISFNNTVWCLINNGKVWSILENKISLKPMKSLINGF